MQADNITLQVDVLGNDVLVPHTYTRVTEMLDKSIYNGEDNTRSHRDELTFSRKYAKASGDYRGADHVSVKITQADDVAVRSGDGTTVADIVFSTSGTIPVGASDAKVEEVKQRLIAAIASAEFGKLVTNMET